MIAKIVTIDGPAGCGKSTVSRKIAARLGGRMFSSGRIYRTLTWLALEDKIDLSCFEDVAQLPLDHVLSIVAPDAQFNVLVDGKNPGDVLDSTRVTKEIHYISGNAQLRQLVLPLQRSIPSDLPVVAEGRDMGTVVFPDAPVKIFLTATSEQRAIRRHEELKKRLGEEVTFEEVLRQVIERDDRDSERDISPMRPAEGSCTIDSTECTIEMVVDSILERIPPEWIPETNPSTD
ncbi:MAG: (d)CMP kinase [Planctomycetia bacterium]|nr:(d)CMP kinase [Planctomycetia bacterium]MBL6913875.1 (d)CMP kinase [Planctomycetota bacterium]MDA9264795.1 (d)CMP kinase [Planctomycetota bacterium]HCW43861.1 (d)CMP kinase [Planctomycetota bacterium]